MQEWVADTDIDGFNLAYLVSPETFESFVDLVVPELQRRGVFKRDYGAGVFRDKLIRRGPKLPPEHPGAKARVW